MDFSIILPIHDPRDNLVSVQAMSRTISGVLTLVGDFQLIVINNNRTSDAPNLEKYLREVERTEQHRVTVLSPDCNLGAAKGFNLGLRASDATSKYVVFMSADTDITDSLLLVKIASLMDNEPSIAIAHPVSVFEDLNSFNHSRRFSSKRFIAAVKGKAAPTHLELTAEEIVTIQAAVSKQTGITRPMRSFPLSFAVLRRSAIALTGSFDDEISTICGENDDLAYRTLLMGFAIAKLNSVFVNHRRYLFFRLGHDGVGPSMQSHHREGLRELKKHWQHKWGRPYIELYTRWRYGSVVFGLMLPVFWARRFMWHLRGRAQKV